MTSVLASAALCPPGPPAPGWVAIDDGVIVETGPGRPPAGAGAVDAGSALLAPGLIDLQVNGVDDDDFAAADPEGWRRAGRAQLEHGVTAFCPTLVTAPLDRYDDALALVQAVRAGTERGPSVVGVHLEGPFLGGAPGAHPVDLVRDADVEWLRRLLAAFPGVVSIVTLAPEADPGLAATRFLCDQDVAVALGHSTATYDDARAAADAGARLVTHLFNGMAPFHHREPGLVGAALDDERLTPTLIADFVHVHPAALRLAIARKRNVALVTDRVATTGLDVTEDGAARLSDGTIAGSTLSMNSAVRNVVALGVPIERAVEMASVIPADVLGLTDRGRLEPGARADIVAFDPGSLAVRAVWLSGELVFDALDH